jgi:hypothetical protein
MDRLYARWLVYGLSALAVLLAAVIAWMQAA